MKENFRHSVSLNFSALEAVIRKKTARKEGRRPCRDRGQGRR